jgi:PhnB protein
MTATGTAQHLLLAADRLSASRSRATEQCWTIGFPTRRSQPWSATMLLSATTKEHVMASKLNPYLSFAGNARQAMEFYKDVFGGELTMNTFGEMGGADSPNADNIMHAQLETPAGYTLMASDGAPGADQPTPGNNMSISLSGDDAELRDYWEKLADGATVTIPLEKQMWGDEFGALVDRFGISWMVNISQAA